MFGPANIEAVLHDAEHDELDELEDCEQTSTQEESQNTTNVTEKISHVVVDNFPDFRCSHTGEEYLQNHHVLQNVLSGIVENVKFRFGVSVLGERDDWLDTREDALSEGRGHGGTAYLSFVSDLFTGCRTRTDFSR